MTIREVAAELNRRAADYSVGDLPALRMRILGKRTTSSRQLFSSLTIKDHYAFHVGGRTELQFNFGFEPGLDFRHGVAFSLEPGINLKDVSILYPQIRRFNEYFELHPEAYSDMRLWYWRGHDRSPDFFPMRISDELAQSGHFIFMGRHYDPAELDYDAILADFDLLLPLYEFVIGSPEFPAAPPVPSFLPGHRPGQVATTAHRAAATVDVSLRHNLMATRLYTELCEEFGPAGVRTELGLNEKARVDIVAVGNEGRTYFEIKTASSARGCVREALAQLLEYAFWPGAHEPAKIVVVGEPDLDSECELYLRVLRDRFGVPVHYRTIKLT